MSTMLKCFVGQAKELKTQKGAVGVEMAAEGPADDDSA